MSGLDILLAESISNHIKENLGEAVIQKIETRLKEKFDCSLSESIESFHRLDSVLHEFFGNGAESIEKQIVELACRIEKSNKSKSNWIIIDDPLVTQTILKSFGDSDKRKILESLAAKPQMVSEILEKFKIPQTSGYRKLNSLIKDGLIIDSGQTSICEGKIVKKYVSVFENLKINIFGDNIKVNVQIRQSEFENCSILQTVYNF